MIKDRDQGQATHVFGVRGDEVIPSMSDYTVN